MAIITHRHGSPASMSSLNIVIATKADAPDYTRQKKGTYPMRIRQTSLAVFFSRKAPIFWILDRRLVA